MIDSEFIRQRELLKTALEATDGYLGVEKQAMAAGQASPGMIHDFTYQMSRAHDALQNLGVLDQHTEYLRTHVETMMKLSNHDDSTLSDLPYAHVPKADFGEVEESFQIDEEADKGLAAKAAKSGISVGTLRKVYNRGMAAWRTGHRPGTTPHQWAMARVNSYIMKGKGTYYGADKDLREESEEEITDEELNKIVDQLKWEDLVDFYGDEDLVEPHEDDEENQKEIKEALSQQARLKKKQTFARFKSRRNVAKGMKLRRASDFNTLQKRAKLAARRALYKRFLRGRDKSTISAAEKSRIEQQVSNLKVIQNVLAQRMIPKIKSIEQKRLASYRIKK